MTLSKYLFYYHCECFIARIGISFYLDSKGKTTDVMNSQVSHYHFEFACASECAYVCTCGDKKVGRIKKEGGRFLCVSELKFYFHYFRVIKLTLLDVVRTLRAELSCVSFHLRTTSRYVFYLRNSATLNVSTLI